MTIAAFFDLLTGLFQFPAAISALIKLLRATPESQQASVIASIQAQAATAATPTGRPTWGS